MRTSGLDARLASCGCPKARLPPRGRAATTLLSDRPQRGRCCRCRSCSRERRCRKAEGPATQAGGVHVLVTTREPGAMPALTHGLTASLRHHLFRQQQPGGKSMTPVAGGAGDRRDGGDDDVPCLSAGDTAAIDLLVTFRLRRTTSSPPPGQAIACYFGYRPRQRMSGCDLLRAVSAPLRPAEIILRALRSGQGRSMTVLMSQFERTVNRDRSRVGGAEERTDRRRQ